MIALTNRILWILQLYRVFIAAVGLTWVAVAIGVARALDIIRDLTAVLQLNYLILMGFLAYLVYASFYGVYGISRQILEYRGVRTILVKLKTETFLAIAINVGVSSILIDHLILEYGTKIHAMMLIALLIAASSFTRHPFLKRVVNYFRRKLLHGNSDDMAIQADK